jgi:electron-transferring-flavoprotein dehydrogenase
VSEDRFLFLTETGARQVPNALLPDCFRNHGNYVVSLANVCRWLGKQAEELGVDLYPGFAAAEILFNDNGSVRGVATGDMGIGRDGQPGAPASNCMRNTPSSPKAAAGTWACA